jgi:CRP-like cAMP-binding protein
MYYGLEQQDTYVLKEGIVKTSIILRDGREFNISYIKGPDIISLLKDEVSQYTSA